MSEKKIKSEVKTAKLEFTFSDRLLSNGYLPTESDHLTMLVVRDLKKKLELPPEDLVSAGFKVEGSVFKWEVEAAAGLGIFLDLSSMELKVLKDQFKKLSDEKKITLEILDLSEKIESLSV